MCLRVHLGCCAIKLTDESEESNVHKQAYTYYQTFTQEAIHGWRNETNTKTKIISFTNINFSKKLMINEDTKILISQLLLAQWSNSDVRKRDKHVYLTIIGIHFSTPTNLWRFQQSDWPSENLEFKLTKE